MPEIRELKSISITKLKGLKKVAIDFGDDEHRITGIFGLNGCGKTTILHTIMCLYRQTYRGMIAKEYVADTQMSRYFKHVGDQYWRDSEYKVKFMYEHQNADGSKQYIEEEDPKTYKKYYSEGRNGRRAHSEWSPRNRSKQERSVFFMPIHSCMPDLEEITLKSPSVNTYAELPIQKSDAIRAAFSQIMGRSYTCVNHVDTGHLKHYGYNVDADGNAYHSLSMGAGEQRLLRILEVLYNAPQKSLIVIDEIDLTLHTAALRELFVIMRRLAKTNKLQIVFTSHRQEIMDFDNVNVRFIINTPTQTFCLSNPTAQCYEQLTGVCKKSLRVFVEDDTSKYIVEQVLMQHKLKRYTEIVIAGAAKNLIAFACAIEIQKPINSEDRSNTLFVIDGDEYEDTEKKIKQIKNILTGNGEEMDQRRSNVLTMLTQYQSIPSLMKADKNMSPEEYIYNALIAIPEGEGNPEIVSYAKGIGVVADAHDYLIKMIENDLDIKDIMMTFRATDKWQDYVHLVDAWAAERQRELEAERVS